MRIPRKYILGGAVVALLGAGVAQAATAKLHTMKVDAPDGGVVEVHYTGDVAPRIAFMPATPAQAAAYDPFAAMERISAAMDAQMQAMMQRAAIMQQQAAAMQQGVARAVSTGAPQAPGFMVAGNMPPGMHVTYVSSSTDANGCTRTVSYSSDGSGAQPKMTQAASDGCDAAKPNAAPIPVKAEAPASSGSERAHTV